MLLDEAQACGARLRKACATMGLDRKTVQRWRGEGVGDDMRMGPKSTPANKLSPAERAEVLRVVNSPEFCSLPPKQIVPILADSGIYLASESTLERILRDEKMNAHRGPKRQCSAKKPREKVAVQPGQLWSWDITYLRSLTVGEFYYLYLVVDIWSRKIVGYTVHDNETSELASAFLSEAYEREGRPGHLIVHQDNGSPMKGSTLKATLDGLGVARSYSRPHVSDDNPVSESLFGTMKTRPNYPNHPFESLQHAQQWVDGFVNWYNETHRHSSIGYVTPSQRHAGVADDLLEKRRAVYVAAKQRNPVRWAGCTRSWLAPVTMFLNPDKNTLEAINR